jgi:hypothetical protein
MASMASKVARRGRLMAIAGLLAGVGVGVGTARGALAGHGAGETGDAPLHVGGVNDTDGDADQSTTGILASTVLVASATSALEVRNLHAGGFPGMVSAGSDVPSFATYGGEGIVAFGGAYSGTTNHSACDGGSGLRSVGGFTASPNAAAYGGDGVNGVGGTATAAARHGAGVRGQGAGSPGSQAVGVVGETNSFISPAVAGINSGGNLGVLGTSGGTGIRGVSFGSTSAGVEGVAGGSGPGVWGFTASGHAVLGNSTTGNGGVFSGKTGVTTTGSPNALVANGNVHCTGTGKFIGGIIVAGRGADGGLRATYGMTSPDQMVEDFGRARLVNGHARVELDPAFATLLAGGAEYAVFPVPNGDCNGLYISGKSADGFEVRELRGGANSLDFDYRVVAKRAGTQAARFARVVEPEAVTIPAMVDVPRSFADVAHLTRFDKHDRPDKSRGGEQPSRPSGAPTPRR